MAYATTTELKNELNIAASDTSRDDYFDALLTRVSDWIDEQVGYSFGTGAVTVTDASFMPRRGKIWLPQTSITEVTTVEARDLRSDDWTTLTSDQYEWTDDGRVNLYYCFRFAQVTYTFLPNGGDTVPADIKEATLQLATARVNSQQGSNVRTERIGDLQLTYNGPTADEGANQTAATLAKYHVRPV